MPDSTKEPAKKAKLPIVFNSQQTLFLQFCNKEMYLKDLTSIIGFPAPIQQKESHERRDFPDEPILSVMTDIRYEAGVCETTFSL